jgi:hypothetical protein
MALDVTRSAPFGDPRAAVESEPYATRWRIDLAGAVKNLDLYPGRIDTLVGLGEKHQLWRFLKRADGGAFGSFREFCETPEPHGLGTPEAVIRSALERIHGKQAVQLVTVPEASKPGPKPDGEPINSSEANNLSPQTLSKLRAINRAPEPVREMYRNGLIGQDVAAKLGPKNPEPEFAARREELIGEIKTLGDKRSVNRTVRSWLGVSASSVDRAMSAVRRMTPPELYDFEARFDEYLQQRRAQ